MNSGSSSRCFQDTVKYCEGPLTALLARVCGKCGAAAVPGVLHPGGAPPAAGGGPAPGHPVSPPPRHPRAGLRHHRLRRGQLGQASEVFRIELETKVQILLGPSLFSILSSIIVSLILNVKALAGAFNPTRRRP